jgi:branched-chain amino acid transport system permease protein
MEEFAQIVIGGLLQGSVFAMVALGFSLVFRVTGAINLVQGAFCIIGALSMYSLGQVLGWPAALAALGAAAIVVVAGLAIGAAVFVPGLSRLPVSGMLIMTAGLLTLVEGAALLIWGSQPYALPPFSGEAPVEVFGLRVTTQGFWIAAVTLAVIAGLWYLLMRTTTGKALRACAENPTAARLMGIDVPRETLLSFALAAFIGGLGGIVVGPITSLEFDTGRFFTIYGFVAVAIGGLGSFVGAVVGGLLLGVVEQLAAGYVSSLFANSLAFGMLLVVLLWRPSGLFSSGPQRRTDVRDEHRIHPPIVRLQGRGAVGAGVAAVVVLAVLPWLISSPSIMSSLVITGILFIALLGLDLLMGYTGQVSLGQAAFMAIGGYAAAILATTYGWSPLVATGAGILLSVASAIVLSLFTMRLRGHYLALATLAFGLLIDSFTVGLTDVTGGPSGLVGIPSFAVGPLVFDTSAKMYYLVLALVVVLVLVLHGGVRLGFGRALQAVRTDQTAAAALGINVARHKLIALAISAALASLAGSLYAFYFHFLSPEMVGTPRSLELLAMLVLGGEGTLVGPLFGAAILTLLPTIFQPLAAYKTFATGALLVLAVRYLPGGIFGASFDRLRRFRIVRAAARAAPIAGQPS